MRLATFSLVPFIAACGSRSELVVSGALEDARASMVSEAGVVEAMAVMLKVLAHPKR
jgi:hypothetical protein